MTLLTLLGGSGPGAGPAPPPAIFTDGNRRRYQIEIVSPNRQFRVPVDSYTSMSASAGDQGQGELSLVFDPGELDMDVAGLMKNDAYGWSIDFINLAQKADNGRPLFSGPIIRTDIGYGQGVTLSLTAESFKHHLLRRRQALTLNNAIINYAGVAAGTILSNQINLAFSDSVVFTPPYPGGARDNVSPWDIVDGGTFAAGSTLHLQEESGTNAWDFCHNVATRGGLALFLDETPAGTFRYGASTYLRNDYSNRIVWTDGANSPLGSGVLLAARKRVDYSALTNIYLSKGAGAGTDQSMIFVSENTSLSTYGGFEDSGTNAGVLSTAAMSNDTAKTLEKLAFPVVTWEIDVILDDEFAFGYDVNLRDKISFWHSGFLAAQTKTDALFSSRMNPVEAIIVGWSVTMEQGRPRWVLTLNQPLRNWESEILSRIGSPGGRGGGGRYTPRNGW